MKSRCASSSPASKTAAEERDASDVLAFVADDYEDANGFDKSALQNFLRGWLLAHPKVELLVNVESLEFPADGLAQADISVTSVSLERSRSRAPEGGIPPQRRRLARAARGSHRALKM